MVNNTKQIKYNQAIDNIAYLIINYGEPLKQLLADYGITFKGNPSDKILSETVIEQLEVGDKNFETDLEALINKLTATDEDQFFGSILKGAVGLVGGLIRKRKNKRRARRAARASSASQGRSFANSQALAAKRDLERRMRRQREEQRRREAAEARRRREAEERRRRERQERERKEAEAKKKTNMMLMIGGGVVVLGIGAAMFMKSNRPPMPYPQMRPPAVPM